MRSGLKRRSSSFNTGRIEGIYQDPHVERARFHLHYGDLTDSTNLIRSGIVVGPLAGALFIAGWRILTEQRMEDEHAGGG